LLAGDGNNREMIIRPAIFKWRHTKPGIIFCAFGGIFRYSLSVRDVEELLEERDLSVDCRSHNGLAVGAGLRP
jgi:hypothetical protein